MSHKKDWALIWALVDLMERSRLEQWAAVGSDVLYMFFLCSSYFYLYIGKGKVTAAVYRMNDEPNHWADGMQQKKNKITKMFLKLNYYYYYSRLRRVMLN